MNLPTLITTLDNTGLTRRVVSSHDYNGVDVISYVNETRSSLTLTVNSEDTYTNLTQICLIVKNGLTYLYVQCNNIPFFNKILLSSVNSISVS